MDAKTQIKKALSAVQDAMSNLQRVRHVEETYSEVRRARSELDDAESKLKKALRELPG
jgi:uncharacterized membrane protein YjjP (DUF1212 family)